MLKIDIVTIFPGYFKAPLGESLLERAQAKKLLSVAIHDLRDYTYDRHRTVDDKPFGGGPGMVMKPEPIFECVKEIQPRVSKGWVIVLDPKGERLTQRLAKALAARKRLILICGHYEGIDHRVHEHLADQIISVGDFVTMGGEAPALCLIEAVSRLLPGVIGNTDSLNEESFEGGNLEYPQYTRPREYRGMKVPEVIFSGDHQKVAAWRRRSARKINH